MTQSIQFDRKALDAQVIALQALVDSVKAQQGSAAKRIHDATLNALGEDVNFDQEDIPTPFNAHGRSGSYSQGASLGDIAVYVQELNDWAEQLRDETVRVILKASGNSDNVTALKAQYADKRTLVEAMITLCKAQGFDVSDVVVPALRVGRPVGSTNAPNKPGSKFAHFYRVVNGERIEQSEMQNSLSSFAWYYGAKVTETTGSANKGKGVPVSELDAYLRKNGVESPMGKPWTIERDGVTYGMSTTEPEEASSEEE